MRRFRDALVGQDFSISAELSLRRESTVDDIHRQVDGLGEWVDGIQVADNPWSWVQMSAMAAASIVLSKGVDAVPLLTCRDRNRIALQSDLIGLRAMGVTSVLATHGEPMPEDHQLEAVGVFDATGGDLVRMANELNQDVTARVDQELFIGTGAQLFRPKKNWPAKPLKARINAGARFVQPQFCFDVEMIRAWVGKLVEMKLTWKCAVLISLAVMPSAKTAIWLRENISKTGVPVEFVERLENASDPEREGIRMCAKLMQQVSEIPGVSGVNLVAMGSPDSIPAVIEASGLRS